jgi:hypothetical protein
VIAELSPRAPLSAAGTGGNAAGLPSLMAVVVGAGAHTAPNSPPAAGSPGAFLLPPAASPRGSLGVGGGAPANATVRVTGAGVSKVNGFYAASGACGNRPRYRKVDERGNAIKDGDWDICICKL